MKKRSTSESQAEYKNSQPDEESSYPGARNEEVFWQSVTDQNFLQFGNRLEKISENAAHTLDHRLDIRKLPETESEKILSDYAQAFRQMEFQGVMFEKRYAARDIAQALFKPMKEEMDQKCLDQLKDTVRGEFHTTEILNSYMGTFEQALEGSHRDNKPDLQLMCETFKKASSYVLKDDSDDPGELSQAQFSELAEASDDEKLTESLKIVHHTWRGANELLSHIQDTNTHEQHAGESYLMIARYPLHQKMLSDALSQKSYEAFNQVNEAARLGREEFAENVQNNRGFVEFPGYEQCKAPEKFETPQEASEYNQKIRDQLQQITGNRQDMSQMAYQAAIIMSSNLNDFTENAESETKSALNEIDTEYGSHLQNEASFHLEMAHSWAKKLEFIMKPRTVGEQT